MFLEAPRFLRYTPVLSPHPVKSNTLCYYSDTSE